MSASVSIPQNVQIKRNRLLGLIAGVAAAAAAVMWAVLAFGIDTRGGQVQANVPAQPAVVSSPIPMTGYLDGITSHPSVVGQPNGVSFLSPSERRYVDGVSSLTPVERAAAFGGPGTVLDALQLDPKSRRYVEAITALSNAEKAAAFGH